MTSLRLVPFLAVAVVTLSCTGPSPEGDLPSPTPSTSTASPEPATDPTPDRRTVRRQPRIDTPDVIGRSLERAVRLLQNEGLSPSWALHTVDRRCGATPTVTEQRPPEGPLRYGSAVGLEVVVGRCPLGDDLRAVADAFVGFARGGPVPPLSEPVLILVGHEVVAVLPPDLAGRRAAWRGCPSSGFYSARVCPFDLLRPFVQAPVRIGTAPPAHACLRAGRLPPKGLDDVRAVTVTHEGSCPDHASVRLYVDTEGSIVAADLELPEP